MNTSASTQNQIYVIGSKWRFAQLIAFKHGVSKILPEHMERFLSGFQLVSSDLDLVKQAAVVYGHLVDLPSDRHLFICSRRSDTCMVIERLEVVIDYIGSPPEHASLIDELRKNPILLMGRSQLPTLRTDDVLPYSWTAWKSKEDAPKPTVKPHPKGRKSRVVQ